MSLVYIFFIGDLDMKAVVFNLIYMVGMELFYKVLEYKIRNEGIGFWNKKVVLDCC